MCILYNKESVENVINTKVIGKNIIFFDSITSTNDFLKQGYFGHEHGTVAIAKSQTNGRGRRGNIWENGEDESIFMSILLKPNMKVNNLLKISLVCSMSILKAIKEIDSNLDLKIKWPNDVLIGDKKVCGILTECVFNDINEAELILGVGINVNNKSFPDSIKDKATSLFLENIDTNIPFVIGKVIENLEKNYYTYLQYGFEFFINEYKKMCCNINKDVVVINGNEKTYGKILDVNKDGSLVFQNDTGEICNIVSNEISIRGKNGYI